MKKWIVVGLILLLSINNVSATDIYTSDQTIHYPYGGTHDVILTANIGSDPFTYVVYETFTYKCNKAGGCDGDWPKFASPDSPAANYITFYSEYIAPMDDGLTKTISVSHTQSVAAGWDSSTIAGIQCEAVDSRTRFVFIIYNNTDLYNLTGSVNCVDNVSVDVNNGTDWVTIYYNNSNQEYDSFSVPIVQGVEYRIMVDGTAVHQFTCDGDESFSYNACLWVYGYTCNIDSISLWRYNGSSWVYQGVASQWKGYDTYEMQIEAGYNYRLDFSDGHQHFFTCMGSDVHYDWDRCEWVFPPSPYQPPEIIQPILGYDNNIVFMRDGHGNFIKNSQIAVYNKANHTYNQKWTDTQEPYVLLAANNDSDDDVIVMCKTFDGTFILETTDPAFGTDENITWTNWTIPLMYNLDIRPIDQNRVPLHDVFVSMYEYTPFKPLSFSGYDTYWGYMPITNCSGFSRCDILAERGGYVDYNITGLNWTSKSAMIKNYKHDLVMVKE